VKLRNRGYVHNHRRRTRKPCKQRTVKLCRFNHTEGIQRLLINARIDGDPSGKLAKLRNEATGPAADQRIAAIIKS
jgi:hypothetical protein